MEQRITLVHGYANKLRKKRKRFFVLTVDNEYLAPRLAIYENESKWVKNLEPKILSLSNLFFVEKLQRSKISNGLGLYMETSLFELCFQDNAQLQKWHEDLDLIVYKNKKRLNYPKIEHCWQASIKFKSKSVRTGFMPASGDYRVCLCPHEVLIINTCIMSPTLAIDYTCIRNSLARVDGQFILELGHMAPTGECDIIMQMADDMEVQFALQCITMMYRDNAKTSFSGQPRYKLSSRRSIDPNEGLDVSEFNKGFNFKRFSSPPSVWTASTSLKSDSRLSEIFADVETCPHDGTFSSAETIKNSLQSSTCVSEYLPMDDPRASVSYNESTVSRSETPMSRTSNDVALAMKTHEQENTELITQEFPMRANSVGARLTFSRNSFVSSNVDTEKNKGADVDRQGKGDDKSVCSSHLFTHPLKPSPAASSGKRSNDSLSHVSNASHRDNEEIFMEINFSESPRSRTSSDASRYRDRNCFASRLSNTGPPVLPCNSFRARASSVTPQTSIVKRPINLNRYSCLPNQSSSSSEIQDEYMEMSSTISSNPSIEKMVGSHLSTSSLNNSRCHMTNYVSVAMPTTASSTVNSLSSVRHSTREPPYEEDSLYPVCDFSDPVPVLLFQKSPKSPLPEDSNVFNREYQLPVDSIKSNDVSDMHLYTNI